MARMLVTGAKGMVGSYIPRVFAEHELLATDIDTLDACSPEAVEAAFKEFKPELLLHLAAATDVDRCQQEPDWAFRSNAAATENLALACRRHGTLMVYTSTGAVFPGDRSIPYAESDRTSPSNVYAASKLAGEEAVRGLLERYFVVRAGWIFGGVGADKKFVGKIAAQIVSGKTEILAVNDKHGTPTYAKDFLGNIRRILTTDSFGVFHGGNAGSATRYDVALEIVRVMGRKDVRVVPVSSDRFPMPAPRANEALSSDKMRLLGLQPPRPWQDALAEYLLGEVLPSLKPSP
jgi:dTDP-4-dehydrorhamnose reductase